MLTRARKRGGGRRRPPRPSSVAEFGCALRIAGIRLAPRPQGPPCLRRFKVDGGLGVPRGTPSTDARRVLFLLPKLARAPPQIGASICAASRRPGRCRRGFWARPRKARQRNADSTGRILSDVGTLIGQKHKGSSCQHSMRKDMKYYSAAEDFPIDVNAIVRAQGREPCLIF